MARILIIFLLFCMNFSVRSQYEPQISMHYSGQLSVNPAFAGSSGNFNLTAVNRQQWVGFEGAPTTTVAGVDGAIKMFDRFHGFGLMILNDEIGAFNSLMLNLNYAYRIELDRGEIGLGLKLGLLNTKFDGSKLNPTAGQNKDDYHQESDEAILKSKVSGSALDLGFGAHYQTSGFFVGLSIVHLNHPKPSFNEDLNWGAEPTLFLSSGYLYHLKNKRFSLEPRMMLKSDFKGFQMEIGSALHYNERMWGALSYRHQEVIILQVGAVVAGNVKLGYGYDLNISKLSGYQGGTHEIMLGYNFSLSLEKRSKAYKSVRFL